MPHDKGDAVPVPGAKKLGHKVLSDERWRWLGNALGLSGRQLQIVQCIFDDYVEARIALELGISEHTVHTHVERLYRKLGVSSRCELLVRVFAEYLAHERAATGDAQMPERCATSSAKVSAQSARS